MRLIHELSDRAYPRIAPERAVAPLLERAGQVSPDTVGGQLELLRRLQGRGDACRLVLILSSPWNQTLPLHRIRTAAGAHWIPGACTAAASLARSDCQFHECLVKAGCNGYFTGGIGAGNDRQIVPVERAPTRPIAQRGKIQFGSRRMGVFMAAGYFEQFGKLAGDDRFRKPRSTQARRAYATWSPIMMQASSGRRGRCCCAAISLLRPVERHNRFTAAGPGHIQCGIDGVGPGFGRYRADDAGRAEDRKPADDSQTGVEGLFGPFLAVGN